MIRVILNFESPLYISISALSSTHPCGVRRPYQYRCQHRRVSIHTPVWGATEHQGDLRYYPSFNPRTRVGCDFYLLLALVRAKFQSTHPCGVRLDDNCCINPLHVSIHAPVWGATSRDSRSSLGRSFNPRTRVGCDSPSKV